MSCPCEPGGSFRAAVRRDLDRAVVHLGAEGSPPPLTAFTALRAIFFFPGVLGVLLYRLGHLAYRRLPVARRLGWLPTRLSAHLVGIEFDPATHVGPGLFVNHFGGVFIGARSIGENVNISHGVTVGRSALSGHDADDMPVLGDRVWIGPGAVVVGKIAVGHDAVVGANSVVVKDVAPRAVAVGNPARAGSMRGSFAQVRYRGMEGDPAREQALALVGGATGEHGPSHTGPRSDTVVA